MFNVFVIVHCREHLCYSEQTARADARTMTSFFGIGSDALSSAVRR